MITLDDFWTVFHHCRQTQQIKLYTKNVLSIGGVLLKILIVLSTPLSNLSVKINMWHIFFYRWQIQQTHTRTKQFCSHYTIYVQGGHNKYFFYYRRHPRSVCLAKFDWFELLLLLSNIKLYSVSTKISSNCEVFFVVTRGATFSTYLVY